jgi:hypothetical protein
LSDFVLVIVVAVERKLPLESIPLDQRIPVEIQGVKTDVSPGARPQLIIEPTPDERRFRDLGLRGGIQINREGIGEGTLGCIALHVVSQGNFVVALTNAHVVNAINLSDTTLTPKQQRERVGHEIGQPTAGGSDCSGCCSDIIGKVLRSRWADEVDSAIVLLDPGLKWVAEIEELGVIAGTNVLDNTTDAQFLAMNIVVKKRGRTSLTTRGVIRSSMFTTAPVTQKDPNFPTVNVVTRTPKNQLRIFPTPPFRFVVEGGDSGSVSVDRDHRVVGNNWGKGEVQVAPPNDKTVVYAECYASRISKVMDELQLVIPIATQLGQIQIVPESNKDAPGLAEAVALARAGQPATAVSRARDRLEQSAAGRQYLSLVRDHQHEVRTLITNEKRVAAVWRRSRGAWLGSRVLSAVHTPDTAVFRDRDPAEVLEACNDIVQALERYGSPALRADLARLKPLIPRWIPYSISEILAEMETADGLDGSHESTRATRAATGDPSWPM